MHRKWKHILNGGVCVKKGNVNNYLFPIYIVMFLIMLCSAYLYNKTANALALNELQTDSPVIIVDAGHGGVDGGAVSVDGTFESTINLQISGKLNDLLHFFGHRTIMVRDGDYSVYKYGNTIAQKKISDLKQRVQLVNSTENALLVRIHQNYFQDSRYYGPQVFYSQMEESHLLASKLQQALNKNVSPQSKRKIKPAAGVYLMDKINCCGVLVECGFLSNHTEAKKLLDPEYQKALCCVIATVIANHVNTRGI